MSNGRPVAASNSRARLIPAVQRIAQRRPTSGGDSATAQPSVELNCADHRPRARRDGIGRSPAQGRAGRKASAARHCQPNCHADTASSRSRSPRANRQHSSARLHSVERGRAALEQRTQPPSWLARTVRVRTPMDRSGNCRDRSASLPQRCRPARPSGSTRQMENLRLSAVEAAPRRARECCCSQRRQRSRGLLAASMSGPARRPHR